MLCRATLLALTDFDGADLGGCSALAYAGLMPTRAEFMPCCSRLLARCCVDAVRKPCHAMLLNLADFDRADLRLTACVHAVVMLCSLCAGLCCSLWRPAGSFLCSYYGDSVRFPLNSDLTHHTTHDDMVHLLRLRCCARRSANSTSQASRLCLS